MPHIVYDTAVSPTVTEETPEGFAREVDRILADPRGWKKYGYTFARANPKGPPTRASTPSSSAKARGRAGRMLWLRLETSADADALCGAEGFSCWRERPADIIINAANWAGESASELPLARYRNYVIMHEIGHSIGLDHQECPIAECSRRGMASCPASVMQQMTRGPRAVWPCVESDWPLAPSWKIDDPRLVAGPRPRLVWLVALLVLAILLAGLAARAAHERTWRSAPASLERTWGPSVLSAK
jgi:hypothetical protein